MLRSTHGRVRSLATDADDMSDRPVRQFSFLACAAGAVKLVQGKRSRSSCMEGDCCVLVRSDRTAKKMLEASSGASSLAGAFEPVRQKVLPSLWQYGTLRTEYAGALMTSERPVVGVGSQRIVFDCFSGYRTRPGQIWGAPVRDFAEQDR